MPKKEATVTPTLTFVKENSLQTTILITNGQYAGYTLAKTTVDIPWELFSTALANRDWDIEQIAREECERDARVSPKVNVDSGILSIPAMGGTITFDVPLTGLENPSPVIRPISDWMEHIDPTEPRPDIARNMQRAAEAKRAAEIAEEIARAKERKAVPVLKEDPTTGNREWVEVPPPEAA